MRLRRRQAEVLTDPQVTEVVVTETDQAVLTMSGAAERLRALDAEILATFMEWRVAQQRCRETGLLVEIEMADHMRAAYQTWLADLYRDDSEADTSMDLHTKEIGAGEPKGHVHGWPLRMTVGQVTVW